MAQYKSESKCLSPALLFIYWTVVVHLRNTMIVELKITENNNYLTAEAVKSASNSDFKIEMSNCKISPEKYEMIYNKVQEIADLFI